MMRVHGTCVAIAGRGVLLRGPPGAGKSDLALRLIDSGACLVADDQVELEIDDERLLTCPPATIAGLLEVRGVGILTVAHQAPVPLALVVDLVAGETVERLPEEQTIDLLGRPVRRIALDPREPSAAAKVRLVLGLLTGRTAPSP